MEIRELVERLASGHIIRSDDLGGHDGYEHRLVPEGSAPLVEQRQIAMMIRDGWLESFNGGYRLTDEGRAAYMRSTDELGDGVLRAPRREHGG